MRIIKNRAFNRRRPARPVPPLMLYGNLGYTNAQYKSVNPLALGIGIDNELPATPEWNWSVGGSFTFDIAGGGLELRADYNHRSSVFYGASNAPLEFQKGFGLLEGRVAAREPEVSHP